MQYMVLQQLVIIDPQQHSRPGAKPQKIDRIKEQKCAHPQLRQNFFVDDPQKVRPLERVFPCRIRPRGWGHQREAGGAQQGPRGPAGGGVTACARGKAGLYARAQHGFCHCLEYWMFCRSEDAAELFSQLCCAPA